MCVAKSPISPQRLPNPVALVLRRWTRAPGPVGRLAQYLFAAARQRTERALLAAGDPSLVVLHGVRLLVPLPLAQAFVDRSFDTLTVARLRRWVKPGMSVVDVGAHIGFYTLLFAHLVGPEGDVVAVEPAPDNLELLQRNVSTHCGAVVQIVPCAAGAHERERLLELSESSDTHSFYRHPLVPHRCSLPVRERRLDQLLARSPHLVKVDVEGAELEVLEGLEGKISATLPQLLVLELNPACLAAAGSTPAELLAWLDRHGFPDLELLDEANGVSYRGAAARTEALRPDRPLDWFANLLARRA